MTNCKRFKGRCSDLILTGTGRMRFNAAIKTTLITHVKIRMYTHCIASWWVNTQQKHPMSFIPRPTQCRNIWTSELTESSTFLEIPISWPYTYTLTSFYLFIVSPRQEMCSIYTGNWSFILTFVKLWEAEITGLARSQTFPGAQGIMKQRFCLVWNKKSPPFFLFLHLQGKIGWLFSTALLGLMNDMHHRVDQM